MSNTKRWTCRCVKGCSNQTLYPKKKQQRRKPKSTNKSLALQLFDFSCEWVMCGDSSPPHLEFACEWVVWRRGLNVDDSSPPHLEFSWEWVVWRGVDTESKEEGRKEGSKGGMKEGGKEGRREGRKGGMKEGRNEGRREGRKEAMTPDHQMTCHFSLYIHNGMCHFLCHGC